MIFKKSQLLKLFESSREDGKVKIRKLERSDISEISEQLEKVFYKTGMSKASIWAAMGNIDFDISVVATVDGKLAGFYFLNEEDIPEIGDYSKFKNKRGVEGVALGVFPQYQNKGIGKKLIEYTQERLDYDYIWGMQLKSLENINDWLKRRKIYYENPSLYITYRMLK